MDRPFPPPSKGEPLTAAYLAQLVDAIRANRIEAGPGLRAVRTPAGTTLSLAPTEPSGKAPSLWDVKFKRSGTATHAYLYVGTEAKVGHYDTREMQWSGAQTVSTSGWLDVGVWTSSSSLICVGIAVTNAEYSAHGDAAWGMSSGLVAWIDSWPYFSGYTVHPLVFRAVFAMSTDGFHKLCGSPVSFSSRPADGENINSSASSTAPNYRSIAPSSRGPLQVNGFDSPTIEDNPWAADVPPTGVTNNDWLLMIRRKVGSEVQVRYIPLASVAGSPEENGQPPEPTVPDIVQSLLDQPCNDLEGHETYYAWNPCEEEWVDLAKNGASVFWKSGGNNSSCYGSVIGNSSATATINLDSCYLFGSWTVSGLNGGSGGDLSLTGSLMAQSIILPATGFLRFGLSSVYKPKQITYLGIDGREHTETILAKE